MSFFKLGKMTFGSLFKKPATTRYPFESRPQPVGLKGQIAIQVDQCILCGACERNCNTGCITVNKSERYWEIDRYGCIQCGYCISTCPKNCLTMLPDYAPAAPLKVANRFDIPEAQPKEAKTKKEPVGDTSTKTNEMLPSRPTVEKLEAEDRIASQVDYQLEDLLRLMESDRAAKARKALER